ncbi:13189_t:CDS:2, partial [Funneliformis mosseae]
SDEIPVRSEGTRVLVNLVKKLWSEHPYKEQEGISMKLLRQKLNKVEIIEPLVNMVIESKYPILQNEGIIALTLLSMDDSAKEINPSLDFLTSEKVGTSDKYPDEIRSNGCMFLEKASKAACGPQKRYLREKVPPVIKPLFTNEHKPISDRLKSDIDK